MRGRLAVLAQVDEHNLFDGENGLAGKDIADFSAHGQRGATKGGGRQAHLDEVAQDGRRNEVNFRHVLGDGFAVSQLNDGVNCCFFIDPTEQAATKKRAVSVEVFGANPFAGAEGNVTSVHSRKCIVKTGRVGRFC